MAVLLEPAQLHVVGDITPDEIATHSTPGRTLGPKGPFMETLDGGIAELVLRKALVENDNVRFRVTYRRGVGSIVSPECVPTERYRGGSGSRFVAAVLTIRSITTLAAPVCF